MCKFSYLYDVTKDGNSGSVYQIDDVKGGADAYGFLRNLLAKKVISPEVFLAVDTKDQQTECLYTAGDEAVIRPKKDLDADYRAFSLCGRYGEKPVCLSFHMFHDVGETPLNVFVILSVPHTGAMKAHLARSLMAVS